MNKTLTTIFILLSLSASIQSSFSQQVPFSFRKGTAPVLGSPTYVFYNKPAHMQLYGRDADDSATVTISGQITMNGFDSVYTEAYKNGSLTRRSSAYLGGLINNFTITHRIKAELAEWKFKTYVKYSSTSVLIDTCDSVVCGDIYVVMGQSNAQNTDLAVTINDQYCRTFGVQTGNMNTNAYTAGDTTWHRSSAQYNNFYDLSQQYPYNVCTWGIYLQKYIRDSCGIPTAIINGARYGTSIYLHQRKNSNPTDFSTYYGKVLYRAQKSGQASKVKAIFWYQGEIDVDAASMPTTSGYATYANKFDSLFKSWKTDYSSLQKVFVMQIRPLSCAGSVYAKELRETQRTLQETYHDSVRVVSTVGLGYYSNAPVTPDCHFGYLGYVQLAQILFKNLGQLYYGATDTADIRPPTIRRAFFTSTAKTKIGMVFNNSNPGSIPADSNGLSIKNWFALNGARTSSGVDSLTLSTGKDTMYLWLSSATAATRLGYIPAQYSTGSNIYNGPWIRNARGLGVLTFNDVRIYEYESVALFTRMATITPAREILADSLIKRLKTHNVWTGDALYIYANLDTGLANVNWLSGATDSFRCIRNGGITFTTDKGYTSDGVTGYLNTQYRPGVSGVNYTLTAGAVSVYSHDNVLVTGLESAFGVNIPGSYLGMILRTSFGGPNLFYTNVSDFSAFGYTNTSSAGLFISNRTDSLTVVAYKNYNGITGIIGTHTPQPAVARPTKEIYVCGYNSNGTAANFITSRIAMFRVGGKFTNAQASDFTQDIEWYMTQVGASFTQ